MEIGISIFLWLVEKLFACFFIKGDHAADTKMRKSRPATAVMWHPSRRVLAVGWETGEVTVWNDSEKEMYDGAMTHHAEVTVLHWTSSGSRLLSGDAVRPDCFTGENCQNAMFGFEIKLKFRNILKMQTLLKGITL